MNRRAFLAALAATALAPAANAAFAPLPEPRRKVVIDAPLTFKHDDIETMFL